MDGHPCGSFLPIHFPAWSNKISESYDFPPTSLSLFPAYLNISPPPCPFDHQCRQETPSSAYAKSKNTVGSNCHNFFSSFNSPCWGGAWHNCLFKLMLLNERGLFCVREWLNVISSCNFFSFLVSTGSNMSAAKPDNFFAKKFRKAPFKKRALSSSRTDNLVWAERWFRQRFARQKGTLTTEVLFLLLYFLYLRFFFAKRGTAPL